jgi:hypothetical protein
VGEVPTPLFDIPFIVKVFDALCQVSLSRGKIQFFESEKHTLFQNS